MGRLVLNSHRKTVEGRMEKRIAELSDGILERDGGIPEERKVPL